MPHEHPHLALAERRPVLGRRVANVVRASGADPDGATFMTMTTAPAQPGPDRSG